MTQFAYEALDPVGRLKKGVREAASPVELRDELVREALTPIRIKAGLAFRPRRNVSAVSEALAADFIADLSRFIRSGLSIVQALAILESSAGSPRSSQLAAAVRDKVVAGQPLSVALAEAGGPVGQLMQTLARAGEATGRLPDILEGGARSLKASASLKRRMVTLSVYPAFVLMTALLAMGVFAFAVLPSLEPAFQGFGDKIPIQTKVVLQAARILRTGLPVALGVAAALAVAVAVSPQLRTKIRSLLQRLALTPMGSGILADLVFAGVSQRLAVAIEAGSPLLTAYRVSIAAITVSSLRQSLEAQEGPLRDGRSLSEVLAATSGVPILLVRMTKVGEGSGDMARLLGEASETLSLRAHERAERFLAILTPVLVVGIGAFIGLIVIVVFQGLLAISQVVDA